MKGSFQAIGLVAQVNRPGHRLSSLHFGCGWSGLSLVTTWFSDPLYKAMGLSPWQPARLTSVQPFLPSALLEHHFLCPCSGSLCAAGLSTQESRQPWLLTTLIG